MRLLMTASASLALPAGVLSMVLAAPLAFAQTVYRCGSSYSQVPCPAGTAIVVDDARSGEQKTQTESAAKRDAKLADDMEKARLKQEAQAAPALVLGSTSPSPVNQQKAGKKTAGKNKGKKKDPDDFTATDAKPKASGKKPKSPS